MFLLVLVCACRPLLLMIPLLQLLMVMIIMIMIMMMTMSDSSQTRIWDGWGLYLARPLVPVESYSWCAGHTAFWTDEGFGWEWLKGCSLFLPPASFFCSSMPVCLELSLWLAFRTDEGQVSQSEASCCHDWWLIAICANCLFSWSFQGFLGVPRSHFPSWSSSKKIRPGMKQDGLCWTGWLYFCCYCYCCH